MKIPWTPNSDSLPVFGVPSGPPSKIWICVISTIPRLPSTTAPGAVPLAVVVAEQVAPIVVDAVAAQVATTGNDGWVPVAAGGNGPAGVVALLWSVMFRDAVPSSAPT